MNKIDIIKVEVDIVKSKLLVFLAVSGGSWVYAIRTNEVLFKIFLFICFVVTSYGVFANILKLSDLDKELKELK